MCTDRCAQIVGCIAVLGVNASLRKLAFDTRDDGMHGVACIAGTRIPVSLVLDNLAARVPEERLLAEYPSLTTEAITAALAYAAELAREQNLGLPA